MLQGAPVNSSVSQAKQLSPPSAHSAGGKNGLSHPGKAPASLPSPMAAPLVDPGHSNGGHATPEPGNGLPHSAPVTAEATESAGPGPTPAVKPFPPTSPIVSAGENGDASKVEVPRTGEALKPGATPVVSVDASGVLSNGKLTSSNADTTSSQPTANAGQQPAAPAAAQVTSSSNHTSQQGSQAEALPTAAAQPALTREAAIERLEGLLRRLSAEHDPEGFFREKVSTDLKGCENYYERIKNPMWLSLISSKVSSANVTEDA